MRKLLFIVLVVAGVKAFSQGNSFPYGSVTHSDLKMNVYERDSSAEAVVLQEFGEAYIDLDDLNKLIVEYHVTIKILKAEGLDWADYKIPLRKSDGSEEILRSVKATSYNLSGNSIVPTQLEQRNVYTDNAVATVY